MKRDLKNIGWTVFIVECADTTYYTGIARDMKKALVEINVFRKGRYFCNHPERVPVSIIYREDHVPFREAYAKLSYMRKMNRRQKKKLINTNQWPVGGAWKEFVENKNFE